MYVFQKFLFYILWLEIWGEESRLVLRDELTHISGILENNDAVTVQTHGTVHFTMKK